MKLLRSTLPLLRGALPSIEHQAAGAVVERLRGKALGLMRDRVLARCGYLCECPQCQAGYPIKLTRETTEIDHIVPIYQGGTNAIGNLRALYRDCHKRITTEQAVERRRNPRHWSDGR